MKRWIGVFGAWLGVRVVLPIDEIEALCFIPDLGRQINPQDVAAGGLEAQ